MKLLAHMRYLENISFILTGSLNQSNCEWKKAYSFFSFCLKKTWVVLVANYPSIFCLRLGSYWDAALPCQYLIKYGKETCQVRRRNESHLNVDECELIYSQSISTWPIDGMDLLLKLIISLESGWHDKVFTYSKVYVFFLKTEWILNYLRGCTTYVK